MRRFTSFIILLTLANSLFSQAPQKMSYQAVIRNSSNTLVTSSAVGVQVSILQGSISGIEVYKEIYSPNPQTNANGLVTIEIGNGIPVLGTFTSIDWAAGPYFIKTEIDLLAGTNYTITGISELLSVPYALYSKTAENIKGGITEADPVFTNHVAFGITSTNITDWKSAYSWGNHANLYSFSEHSHPYLSLTGGEMTNTNVVTNLNSDLLDGQNGSFYAPASIYPENGLTTGYIPFKTSTTLANSPIHVTGVDNLLISTYKGANSSGNNIWIGGGGQNSIGDVNNSYMGTGNVILGFMAGTSITTGYKNVAIGTLSSENLTTGFYNTAVGDGSMRNNKSGSHNVAVGGDALNFNTTGNENSAIGVDALQRNTTGHSNIAIGTSSLVFNNDGSRNVAVGINSLFHNIYGNYNTAIGNGALYEALNNYNVGIGGEAGRSVTYGNENIYIGYRAGYGDLQKVDANNSIAIGSYSFNNADNQVVLGNSLVEKTWLMGSVGINTDDPKAKLDVKGNGNGLGMAFAIHNSIGTETYSITDNGEVRINGSKRIATQGAYIELRNNATGATTLESDGSYNLLLNPLDGNVGIGVIDPGAYKLKVNGTGYFNGSIDATSYKLSGVSTFLGWTRMGFAGMPGQVPISQGNNLTPVWKNLADAGIAPTSVYPASGLTTGYLPYKTPTVLANSPIYTNGSNIGINTSTPSALLDIKGTDQGITQAFIIRNSLGTNTFSISNNGIINLAGSQRMATQDAYIELRNNATGALTIESSGNYNMRLNPVSGNVGIGYTTENVLTNNKLAVNGSIFANGVITSTGGNSTNWNTAYSWGNHAGLYRPISYVPAWSEITSNPFSFSSVNNNQLLKYNSTTLKWENWTPNFLTSFTEADPGFTVWNKSSGINIIASQVSDFQTSVTNNPSMLANTAKNSYPTSEATKLAGIAAGAEVNVNADWNATSGDAQILNKPTIPTGTNQGDMQYWSGTAWVVVPAGQPGQFLQFTASNVPAWTTVLPILTTTAISAITSNSAKSGGNIISSGGGTITARGVCWSTYPNPTLLDNKTTDGTETGIFTSLITGLTSGTIYYVRAYATNSSFTAYGNPVSLTTVP